MNDGVFRMNPSQIGLDLHGAVWLYAPRRHESALVEPQEVEKVSRILSEGGDRIRPCRWNRLILMPTNACNFNCRYCFAAKGRDGSRLTVAACRAAIRDYLIRARPSGTFRLGFLGGGEPCLERELLYASVACAEAEAKRRGIGLAVDLSTNGSVMDDELLRFFRDHSVRVGISFDILETAQESQRGHYALVAENVRKAIRAGVRVLLKATITPDTVRSMREMAQEAAVRFPGVAGLRFQQIVGGMAADSEEALRSYCDAYREGFFDSRRRAARAGLPVGDALIDHAGLLVDRYCPGEYCVTPGGWISACDFSCTPEDGAFPAFCYGRITEDGRLVELDGEKLADIRSCRGRAPATCAACFARYHCAGGCPYRMAGLSEAMRKSYCDFTRRFLAEELFQRFCDSVREAVGRSVGEILEDDGIRERFG